MTPRFSACKKRLFCRFCRFYKGKLDAHRLTEEEIEEIEVLPSPERGLVFPLEKQVERTNTRTAPDAPVTGGSLILNR